MENTNKTNFPLPNSLPLNGRTYVVYWEYREVADRQNELHEVVKALSVAMGPPDSNQPIDTVAVDKAREKFESIVLASSRRFAGSGARARKIAKSMGIRLPDALDKLYEFANALDIQATEPINYGKVPDAPTLAQDMAMLKVGAEIQTIYTSARIATEGKFMRQVIQVYRQFTDLMVSLGKELDALALEARDTLKARGFKVDDVVLKASMGYKLGLPRWIVEDSANQKV